MTLAQVIKKSEIYYDPDINLTQLGQIDQDIIDLFNIQPRPENIKWSPWILRMELNPELLAGHWITIEDIANIIKSKFSTIDVMNSDVNDPL